MFQGKYIAFLEKEVGRLLRENELLLSALLERAGHREAALLMRGPSAPPPPTTAELIAKGKQKYEEKQRIGWRGITSQASRDTIPKAAKDSTEALEQRLEMEKTA